MSKLVVAKLEQKASKVVAICDGKTCRLLSFSTEHALVESTIEQAAESMQVVELRGVKDGGVRLSTRVSRMVKRDGGTACSESTEQPDHQQS